MNFRIGVLICAVGTTLPAHGDLHKDLETSYQLWRKAVIAKDLVAWRKTTAKHRQMEVKNRILSEKRAFPGDVFDLPAPPPALSGLQFLTTKRNGPTANAYYFGAIDFDQSGVTQRNLLVLRFVGGAGQWDYDRAEFINLAALPDVRKELATGQLDYLNETPELLPSGEIPATPVEAREAPYIAKVYVFCPGREVRVQVNRASFHDFINDKAAELVMGGANPGRNEIQFSTRLLPDADPSEPLAIRVYLMSQVPGVQPIKIYEYLATDGRRPDAFGQGHFDVDSTIHAQLIGQDNQ